LKSRVDYTGIENKPYLVKVVVPMFPYYPVKRGTVQKYSGGLTKLFPCLKTLSDEELEDILSYDNHI